MGVALRLQISTVPKGSAGLFDVHRTIGVHSKGENFRLFLGHEEALDTGSPNSSSSRSEGGRDGGVESADTPELTRFVVLGRWKTDDHWRVVNGGGGV